MVIEKKKTINHITIECSTLVQKEYKIRHDWSGTVIHRELCKNLRFNYFTKWYMPKAESALANEMYKPLWNYEIPTDHLIPTRRPSLMIVNKKWEPVGLWTLPIPANHRVKLKENEKKDKYLDLARELKSYETWRWRWYQL